MAFRVTNRAFEEAFGLQTKKEETVKAKNAQEIIQNFLKELQTYLRGQKRNPAAIAIYDWLRRGGIISSFTCRADMVEAMERELRKQNMPYVLVQEAQGDYGFLIRAKDKGKEKKIARHVLRRSADYCTVVSGEEAGEAYLKSKELDKTMLAIGNLSEEEVIHLEGKCNEVLAGEVIGVDKMEDGTYMMSFHGPTAVDWRRNNPFPLALAQTVMRMNGASKAESKQEARYQKAYRKAKGEGFPDKNGENKNPVWVVGHQNKYVKRTARGFELGHAEEIGDTIVLENDLKVDILDDRYNQRLNSALAKITGHRCLYTLPDVIAYFKTKNPYYKNTAIAAEETLLEEVDKVVSNKIKLDSIIGKEGSWEQKLKHYQNELGSVLAGIRDGKIPPGYTREQMVALVELQKTLQVDTRALTASIDKLLSVGVYTRDAGPKRVQDLEKHIEKFRGKDMGFGMPTLQPDRENAQTDVGR